MRLPFSSHADEDDAQPARDWSHLVLTLSIVMSVAMIVGTLCVRFGMQFAEGSRLKKQGAALCADLRHAPGATARDPAIVEECAQLVERHHAACLQAARAEHREFKHQRYPYAACIMSSWPAAHASH